MALVCNDCVKCGLKKCNFIYSCSDEEIDVYAVPVPPVPAARPAGPVVPGDGRGGGGYSGGGGFPRGGR